MDMVREGKGGDRAVLPECSHDGDEVSHVGGLEGGLRVPDLLLLLCPGSIVETKDVASDAGHLRVVLHGGGL